MGEPSLAERNAAENAAIKMEWESWNASFPPFGLLANIHYVRTPGISSFLITTPEGHILIDTGFETTAPRILMSEAGVALLDDLASSTLLFVSWKLPQNNTPTTPAFNRIWNCHT